MRPNFRLNAFASLIQGTGVVTSVPSDSPDDFITLTDLVKKPAYYNVDPSWVAPFLPPIEIIETPEYGSLAAVKACDIFKIRSPKDKVQLAQAKEAVYKLGFYGGTMLIGKYKGKLVSGTTGTDDSSTEAAHGKKMSSKKSINFRSSESILVEPLRL